MNENTTRALSTVTIVSIVIALLFVATLIPPAGAQAKADPSFAIALDADGSATVTATFTYDLTSSAERDAFQTLVDDVEARKDAKARFQDRLRSVAKDAKSATDREMRVTGATIDLTTTADDETGVITLSVTWEGLAAQNGDRLVITEPFTSGFTPNQRFIIRAPDGYTITTATPTPTDQTASTVIWSAGTSLDGLRVVIAPSDASTATSTPHSQQQRVTKSAGQSGFGSVVALLALFVTASMILRRRYSR